MQPGTLSRIPRIGRFSQRFRLSPCLSTLDRGDIQGSAQEWSWHTLAESKSAQPTRAVW